MASTLAIEARELFKQLGAKQVLKGISLGVPERSLFCIAGPNGSGKTTLLNILSGSLKADSGSIAAKGKIAYARQNPHICEDLTLLENLKFFNELYNEGKLDYRKVKELGLEQFQDTKASDLSSGVRRRLELAIALLSHSDIILLDEPTAGLDPDASRELLQLLATLRKEKTILITTHDLTSFEGIPDYLAIMRDGKKIYDSFEKKEKIGPRMLARVYARYSNG